MILFCLPYAGGSEAIYYSWKNYLDPSIKLFPIKLKGRGARLNEHFYKNLEEVIDDIFNIIKNIILDNDYAIYGHSMGSLLAFELYYMISGKKLRRPKHIFFSGYKPPNIPRKENISDLPYSDFLRKLVELGGMPDELINNQELLKIFIPVIHNDIKVLENYNYVEREMGIECDISILNGKEDSINLEEILAWKKHACKEFKIYSFEGNHFFINYNTENIVNIINYTLTM